MNADHNVPPVVEYPSEYRAPTPRVSPLAIVAAAVFFLPCVLTGLVSFVIGFSFSAGVATDIGAIEAVGQFVMCGSSITGLILAIVARVQIARSGGSLIGATLCSIVIAIGLLALVVSILLMVTGWGGYLR